ncbi:MAG: nucleoside kinase [Lachnospiraceae bacterium]|nr:nucleoside kinase [Lachnospiraceae bacterium]
MYKVTIDKVTKEYENGTTFEDIAREYEDKYDAPIALVTSNGKIRELFKKVTRDCELKFITLKTETGRKTYQRSACMMFLKSVYDLYGNDAVNNCRIAFKVRNGLFIYPKNNAFPSGKDAAQNIKEHMKSLSDNKLPFMKKTYSLDDAIALFNERGMQDKTKLFKYRMSSTINLYEAGGYIDYYYGYMLPNAGYVKWFDLIPYEDGFMLMLPDKSEPTTVKPLIDSKKLYRTQRDAENWGETIGLETIGELNDKICENSITDLILVQEAEQERRIAEIAKEIVSRGGVKFVMIAGPSSSGKTSFSHRLSIQLRTLGKNPHPVALDNYFVNRENTPLDEHGNYNFEVLEAIDVKQFNEDMVKLLNGETVEIPSFNFKIGQREYHGDYMKLNPDDILVIEGIHGLNEKMSYALPSESKFKIYISALMNVNIDEHNRIPTTDGRLIRRLVRDARTRGSDAKRTIGMWYSVRKGEEENIFPFQEDADAMFNSAMVYELAMLKPFAEPLLFKIEKNEPEYYEAKRLLKFLNYFLSVPSESLPNNSLCREFVGGSCFNV